MNATENRKQGPLTVNRRALRQYAILETFEAGIELQGTEVKVVRAGEANLNGAYAMVENRELWLHQSTIPPYDFGNRFNHDSQRPRRLLMHRREILRLQALVEQKGLTLVPLSLRLKRGKIKVELGLGKGKTEFDKRETLRRRDDQRESDREVARHWRG